MTPKTAEQINGPQMGKVEPAPRANFAQQVNPIPLPAKVIAARHRAAQESGADAAGRQPGWWDLKNVSGSVEGVIRAIEANANVPAHGKAFLVAAIRAACTGGPEPFNFVYVDAHHHLVNGQVSFSLSIVPDKKLL
jgi:hypothetical protein